jgi:hypothetical protein
MSLDGMLILTGLRCRLLGGDGQPSGPDQNLRMASLSWIVEARRPLTVTRIAPLGVATPAFTGLAEGTGRVWWGF